MALWHRWRSVWWQGWPLPETLCEFATSEVGAAGELTIVAQEDCRTEIKRRWDRYPNPKPTFWCPTCQPPN